MPSRELHELMNNGVTDFVEHSETSLWTRKVPRVPQSDSRMGNHGECDGESGSRALNVLEFMETFLASEPHDGVWMCTSKCSGSRRED